MIASLFFSIAWIFVLPILKWSANFHDPSLGFCFTNLRTLTFSEMSRYLCFFLGSCRARLFCLFVCSICSLWCSWLFLDARFKLQICTRSPNRHNVPWLQTRLLLRGSNGTTFWSVENWLGAMQTSIICFQAGNLTNGYRTRAKISSHHCGAIATQWQGQIDHTLIKELPTRLSIT